MKLSPVKINHLSHEIVNRLEGGININFVKDKNEIRLAIKDIITEEMNVEDQVDQRVREILEAYTRKHPEGSREWDIEYQRIHEEEMNRRRRF